MSEEKKESKDKAMLYALRVLGMRMHSEAELRKKFRIKNFSRSEIETAIEKLKNSKLINDLKFTEVYLEELRAKGLGDIQVKQKLKLRGLKDDLIDSVFEPEPYELQLEKALDLAQTKIDIDKPINAKDKNRIYSFLARKGFDFEICRSVVDNLKSEQELL